MSPKPASKTLPAAPRPSAEAPPPDSFWQKYSPHHEFPVSMTISVLLHATLAVVLVFSGWALAGSLFGETPPPKIEIAYVPFGGGDQASGGGGGGTFAPPGNKENVELKDPPKTDFDPKSPPQIDLVPDKQTTPEIDIPNITRSELTIPDFKVVLPTPPDRRPGTTNPGQGGPGTGGGLGTGKGTGVGPGVGPGSGPGKAGSGIPGPMTRAEILAQRWRFDFSGDAKEHLKKLLALGITVGFKDAKNDFYMIDDLKVRPVTWKPAPFDQYKDSIKWYSQSPVSVLGLSKELQMPGPPAHFVLLLPADREQMIADAELAYARTHRREPQRIETTWFDFHITGGKLQPYVQRQTYK